MGVPRKESVFGLRRRHHRTQADLRRMIWESLLDEDLRTMESPSLTELLF
jgi:hypothetical protein